MNASNSNSGNTRSDVTSNVLKELATALFFLQFLPILGIISWRRRRREKLFGINLFTANRRSIYCRCSIRS